MTVVEVWEEEVWRESQMFPLHGELSRLAEETRGSGDDQAYIKVRKITRKKLQVLEAVWNKGHIKL